MTATSLDLSQIKTDALSAASTFRTLIGLGSSATLNAGSANGVATLGADSKLTAAQIPDISLISYLGSVASQAAMLALTGQQGDWCVRSDLSTTWVITGSDPTLLANWTQLSYPSVPVQSVFGRTGNVVGVSTDYSSVGITNTAIGASNPSTGAFTTLSANSATLSAGTLNGTVLDIAQTWGGTGTYTGLKYNVTDSGPANAASLLMDLQVGSVSKLSIRKSGMINFPDSLTPSTLVQWQYAGYGLGSNANGETIVNINNSPRVSLNGSGIGTTGYFGIGSFSGAVLIPDVYLYRDAADTLAQRRTTVSGTPYPQAYRIYNRYDDASNYERAKIAWSSNVLQIGTEKLGTGAARALELQTDGTTRLTIGTAGLFTIADALDIAVGTTTGTKIGTSTSQKLGFYNATPVVQPTAVADATDAASVITQLNALLSRMRDLGLIAT